MQRINPASRMVCVVAPRRIGWLPSVCLTAAILGGASSAVAAPLAGYFPRQDLVVYAEFDGLDAHADAWKKTAAYKLLNETTAGAMIEELATQLADQAVATAPGRKLSGAEVLTIARHTFRAGFALGIVRKPGQKKPSCVGMVLRGAARGEVRDLLGRLIDARGAGGRVEAVTKPGDRRVLVVRDPREPGFAWWSEGEDLVFSIASPEGADAMIAALDGQVPDASEHPTRVALARTEDGFKPVGLAFFDMAALPELPPQAAALGLDRIRRLDYRWGFQDEALMTITRLVAPSPRAGILALLDQPSFGPKELPSLPSGLTGFTVFSLDPLRLYDSLAALVRATDPNGPAQLQEVEAAVQAGTGMRLRQDILDHLGPKMTFASVPTRIIAPSNPLTGFAQGLLQVPETTLAIEIDDPEGVGKVLDELVERANRTFRAFRVGDERGGAVSAEFRPLKGGDKGYTLVAPPAVLMLPAGMRPTILVGKRSIVLGTTPAAARAVVGREGDTGGIPADDALAPALEHLPAGMTFLTVSDTRQTLLPELIANLPNLVQAVGSGSVPNPFGPRIGPGRFRGGREFRIDVDPDKVPAPEDLRRFLFPATFALTVDDEGLRFLSREAFPVLNPMAAAPVALAMLLPAVQASREAARRTQSINNLKMMGIALHNHHDSFGHFPPGASRDKEGKPLLSWRVAILPFLEQQPLFKEFKLDEPWDSPHNKPLLERMPAAYAVPGARAEPGMTFYRGFSGPGTFFDEKRKDGVGMRDITDGTSNTLGIVEAREAVPWTKPDAEIPFVADAKPGEEAPVLPSLGGHFQGGFDVLFLDGSVRFIKETINSNILRALITRDGGEVISSDQF